ncbi:DNA topoisomerase, partial [Vibrio paucivorans]
LVAKRFIALFYPESERSKVILDIGCTNRCYRASQTTLIKQGWEVIFKGEHQDEPNQNDLDLGSVAKGTQGQGLTLEMEQRETKPPKYFDDAGLLKAMTQAAKFIKDPELRKTLEAKDKDTAGENGSIGTEATRSGHIEKVGKLTHLVSLSKEKGYKNPVYKTTEAGQEFCSLLPDEIVRPDISAIWEGSLDKIAKQEHTIEAFLSDVDRYVSTQVEQVKSQGVPFVQRQGVTCPTCQQGTLTKRSGKNGPFHACNRYPDCKTTFPDDDGKPNLNPKPRQTFTPSTEEFCKQCGNPLVRRPGKKEGSFWWGCSGFPKCKVRFFDQNGKPDWDKGAL